MTRDLGSYLEANFGTNCNARCWQLFEQLRSEIGYADYLGALQRYRVEHPRDPNVLALSLFLIDYPFAARLYPGVLDFVRRLREWGQPVIVSDGDVVFQPSKIARSSLWEAVQGHVLIYVHKEQMLDDIERWHPAAHYVMVDDKLRLLTAVKQSWGERVTTAFPRQGHYARDPSVIATYPPADLSIERIGDLAAYSLSRPFGAARPLDWS